MLILKVASSSVDFSSAFVGVVLFQLQRDFSSALQLCCLIKISTTNDHDASSLKRIFNLVFVFPRPPTAEANGVFIKNKYRLFRFVHCSVNFLLFKVTLRTPKRYDSVQTFDYLNHPLNK